MRRSLLPLVALLALGAWKPRVFPSPVVGALVLLFGCGNVFFMGGRSLSAGVLGQAGGQGRAYRPGTDDDDVKLARRHIHAPCGVLAA